MKAQHFYLKLLGFCPAGELIMKKLVLGMVLCSAAPSAIAAPTDWSDFFKSWENGCDESKALMALTNSLSMVAVASDG